MTKYQFPIKSNTLIITQPFRTVSPVDISKALSIETTDHNGIDVVCGTNEETWGKECVWPFPWPGIVYDSVVNATFGATQAHAQVDTVDPTTGIAYSIMYLHLSSVTKTKTQADNAMVVYNQGDVIGKIGNNGSVRPVPTPQFPLNGSHLHLGLGVKNPGELNYTMVDPLTVFEMSHTVTEETPYDKLIAIANQLEKTNPYQAGIVRAVAGIVKAFTN